MISLEKISEVKIDTLIAGVAAIVAILALLISLRSNFLAKRALILAEQDANSKKANFQVYLINAFRFKSKQKERTKILMFNISISNRSEVKNSFKATLEIEYVRQDSTVVKSLSEHSPELSSTLPGKNFTFFPYNINISEKETESKWLLFLEPESFNNYRIERYLLKIIDVFGISQHVEATLIKGLPEND